MDRHFKSLLGCSIYSATPLPDTEKWISEFCSAGCSFAFTSLNILEKHHLTRFKKLCSICTENNLELIVDVTPDTLSNIGKQVLSHLGIHYIRLDDGFSMKDMKELQLQFNIVLNASTMTSISLQELLKNGIKVDKVIACHNYYPKPYTGISLKKMRKINEMFHSANIAVISFIPGEIRRFPIFEGLPTIETQRNYSPLHAALESIVSGKSDYICIGDSALAPSSLFKLSKLVHFEIPLEADVPNQLKGIPFTNRIDESDYIIRAVESRKQLKHLTLSGAINTRKKGDIVLANKAFMRYHQELEICLTDLPKDDRQEIIGHVKESDWNLLPHIKHPFTFIFE